MRHKTLFFRHLKGLLAVTLVATLAACETPPNNDSGDSADSTRVNASEGHSNTQQRDSKDRSEVNARIDSRRPFYQIPKIPKHLLLEQQAEQHSPDRKGRRDTVQFVLPGREHAIPIEYEEIDGLAIAEGDIILGPVSEMRQVDASRAACTDDLCQTEQPLSARVGQSFRWPAGVIPYEIDSSLSSTVVSRIEDGIDMVSNSTNLLLVERNGHNDYVRFRPGSGCSASVGRIGGRQNINLSSGCSVGNIAHEILHAAGAWHEQSRDDRNDHVKILWDNIVDGKEGNFKQKGDDGMDMGDYDYGSIMHYPPKAFGKDNPDGPGRLTTIEVLDSGVSIGQRSALSNGDINAINALYEAEDCVRFNPDNAEVARRNGRWKIVDGNRWLFDFGSAGQADAQRSLAVIQYYSLDQTCFVGRPNASAVYMLANGDAPSGSAPNEDCLRFNRSQLEVQREASNRWLLTDGRGRMILFDNPGEAYRTQDLIEQYGFNRQCFVGRPDPDFRYFRR